MAHTTPQVSNDGLVLYHSAQDEIIPLGSSAWWHWLDAAETTTFYFKDQQGSFTARREHKNGNWYWYAYRKHHGKLYKAYLGKAEELELSRLTTAAQLLTSQVAAAEAPTYTTMPALTTIGKIAPRSYVTSSVPTNGKLLLTTKLYQPPARPDLVERPNLFSRLTAGLQRKLTLVTAPAGFGKTTLLSAWCSAQSQHVAHAWLSLDDGDNDLMRFWTYVVAALQPLCPAIEEQVMPLLQTLPPPPIESLLTALLNALMNELAISPTGRGRAIAPTILILDDYHVIRMQSIHDALAFLLDHLPSHVHLFIASRSEPPLPLIRLRAQGQLNELQASDLRFTSHEVATFLQQVMKLNLSLDEIHTLDSHTEGWIVGLQLAALSLQGQPNVHQVLTNFTGSHRYIMEYLTGEVLQRQPPHIREFLLQTSILDRLNGALCTAVTGQPNGQAVLEYLEQANLFLIPLDEQRHWYRYHHLFAEFLHDRLQQSQPDLMVQLHSRAATWYEKHEMLTEAIRHALAAHDEERAGNIIEQHAEEMMMRGESALLLHWYSSLPEEIMHSHLKLLIYYAGALISIGQLDAAERYLQLMRQGIERLKQSPGISLAAIQEMKGLYFLCQTALAGYRGNVARTVEFAAKARKFLPEKSTLRSFIPASLGSAYLYSGDFARASQAFVEAINQGFSTHHIHSAIASMAGQGYMQQMEGHLHQAAETYRQIIQTGSNQGGQIITGISMAYTFLGELYAEWNDLDAAEDHVQKALELGQHWGYAPTLSHSYTTLAYIQFARDNKVAALSYMQRATQIIHEHNLSQNTLIVEAYQAWLQQQAGETLAAAQWASSVLERRQESLNYPYDLEHMLLAQILFAQGEMTKAHDLLARLLPTIEASGRLHLLLTGLLLQAQLFQVQGNQEQALTTLARALKQAEPEGYIRTFLERGPSLIPLLRHAMTHGITPTYARELLSAFGELEGGNTIMAENILSERELEVLQCIAAGKSNQEIAQELVVALSTTKTHLNNIYSKLGVHSRTQAIARAKELQLL